MPYYRPSPRELQALAHLAEAETGAAVHVDPSAADACCDMGWVKLQGRRYRLTEHGRALLNIAP